MTEAHFSGFNLGEFPMCADRVVILSSSRGLTDSKIINIMFFMAEGVTINYVGVILNRTL